MPHEIVSFDEPKLQEYLGELVRKTVEDALNALLDAEADQIANAGRYERTDERQAYRSGHYRRGLTTTCGEVELNVPKLRGATFASKVVERYRRHCLPIMAGVAQILQTKFNPQAQEQPADWATHSCNT